MAEPWLSVAEIISCTKGGGTYDGSPYRFVIHTTEGDPGSVDGCRNMAQNHGSPPQLWYHPTLRWLGQGLPLSRSAYALAHPSGTPNTNTAGAIQVEVFGFAADTPGWDVQCDNLGTDVLGPILAAGWPINTAQVAPTTGNDGYGTDGAVRFDQGTWAGWAGVCCHSNVPNNDHWDAGAIDLARVVRAAGGTPAPMPTPPPPGEAPAFPYPPDHYLGTARPDPACHSGYYASDQPNVTTWQAQMSRRGWTISVDGQYGPQSEGVCRQYQAEKGLAVDGLVGPQTWGTSWTAPIT
jgi:hypothetical protein